jgi:hypothetical protein
MPVTTTTLRPLTTVSAGGLTTWRNGFPALVPNGVHDMLNDDSDLSYTLGQVSTFSPTVLATGTLNPMPPGVGKVTGMVIRIRAYRSTNPGEACNVFAGDQANNARFSQAVNGTITAYASGTLTPWTTAAQIAAMQWVQGVQFGAVDGVVGGCTEIYYDITWEPIVGGFKAMMISILGPLVAVGLAEMPAIARDLFRRGRTRLAPENYARAWRELREIPGTSFVDFGAGRGVTVHNREAILNIGQAGTLGETLVGMVAKALKES